LVILSTDITQLIENERLYKQSKAMIAAEERNRLARDLHDSVTQVLFSASLVAEVLPRIWKRDPETAQRSLEELQRLTRGALAEMRTLLLELRPASVVKSPLGELLAQLTEAITSRGGLQFQLFFEQTPVLPEDVHLGFYRIAQEGLNNVVKHAKASLVTVSLIATPDLSDKAKEWRGEVKLMIRDNGVGFADQAESSGHMGLNIIRERARSINADIIINSQPGSGTELILTWHN
jgi:signal transduction histidine kinase